MCSPATLAARILAPCLFTLLACALPAGAADVHEVPSEYATIALAFAACASGDTVLLAPGTYYEAGLTLPYGITLQAQNWDPETTVIDGSTTRATILTASYTGACTINGVGFENGSSNYGGALNITYSDIRLDYCRFADNTSSYTGGAIYWTGGTPEIYGCTFENNTAATLGGGITLEHTDGSVLGCNFNMNSAQWGGGAYVEYWDATTTFQECRFYANTATNGAGAYGYNNCAPTFIQCRFDENDGTNGGGAQMFETLATFTNCTFEANTAADRGAGLLCWADDSTIGGCEFLLNDVPSGGGGGLCLYQSSNCTVGTSWFVENSATWGGGISIETNCTAVLTGCTIAKNTVAGATGGAGISIYDNSTATVDESIISHNVVGEAVYCSLGGTATLTCCCLWANEGGDWVSCIAGQEGTSGNMTANPLFCGLSFYDVYLCADSPCLHDAAGNDCGVLIGALDEGCAACASPVQSSSWGAIKALYR